MRSERNHFWREKLHVTTTNVAYKNKRGDDLRAVIVMNLGERKV